MTQYSLAGTGTPETPTEPRPRRSRPLTLTLRVAETPAVAPDLGPVCSSDEAAEIVAPIIGNADREAFVILHLDVKNQVLDAELHALGAVDQSAVYPREIFRSALLRNASALVFVHNHPSGDPTPSAADKELTRQLVAGAAVLGLHVHDHIILGRLGRHFSMADEGMMDDFPPDFFPGQVREDVITYQPQAGQLVRVKPGGLTPQLTGRAGVVVAFTADADRWPLVAFDQPYTFPSGLHTHAGNGLADRPIPDAYAGRCFYLPPGELEIIIGHKIEEGPAPYAPPCDCCRRRPARIKDMRTVNGTTGRWLVCLDCAALRDNAFRARLAYYDRHPKPEITSNQPEPPTTDYADPDGD